MGSILDCLLFNDYEQLGKKKIFKIQVKFDSNKNSFESWESNEKFYHQSVGENLNINIIENKYRIEENMWVSQNLTQGHAFEN